MARNRPFVEKRRSTIVCMLQEHSSYSIRELAKHLQVSPLTIRRDIQALQEEGLVMHHYGKAALVSGKAREALEERASGAWIIEQAKTAIAKRAAQLLEDGDTVFLNTSSTALLLINHITKTNVTVITNSTKAEQITPLSQLTLLVTGGQVSMPRSVLSGEFALANIRSVSAKFCFLGCAGLSPAAGITSSTLQEATVNSLMFERSDTRVLLADSSKINMEAGFSYAPLSSVDYFITDTNASAYNLEALSRSGIKTIIQVEPEGLY